MWVDPVTLSQERMYRYRRLFPMTEDEYLDESCEVIEWSLHIAAIYGDRPWQRQPRPKEG